MNKINDNTLSEINNVMKSLYMIQKRVDEPNISQNTNLHTLRDILMQTKSTLNYTIATIDEKLILEKKLRNRSIRYNRRSFITDNKRSFITDNSGCLTLEDYEDDFDYN